MVTRYEKEYCEALVRSVECDPSIVGYFPSSLSIPRSSNYGDKSLSTRKRIEQSLIGFAREGKVECLEILSEAVPLIIFERYENYLDDAFIQADLKDILHSRQKFPDTLEPLAALGLSYIRKHFERPVVEGVIDAFNKMGLRVFAKDPRYMAQMMRSIQKNSTLTETMTDRFSDYIEILSSKGLSINPSMIGVDADLSKLYCPGDVTEKQEAVIKRDNKKSAYMEALINNRSKHGTSPFKDSCFPQNDVIRAFIRAFRMESTSDTNMASFILEAFDFSEIFNELDKNKVAMKDPAKYVLGAHSAKEFNALSLFTLVLKTEFGMNVHQQDKLIEMMLDLGIADRLKTADGALRFIHQITGNKVADDLYAMVHPFIKIDLSQHGFAPVDITRLAMKGNLYARQQLIDIERSEPQSSFFNQAFAKMTENEQRQAVLGKLPGFPESILSGSRHNGIKREILSNDMGL